MPESVTVQSRDVAVLTAALRKAGIIHDPDDWNNYSRAKRVLYSLSDGGAFSPEMEFDELLSPSSRVAPLFRRVSVQHLSGGVFFWWAEG